MQPLLKLSTLRKSKNYGFQRFFAQAVPVALFDKICPRSRSVHNPPTAPRLLNRWTEPAD
jgi:hypothetical protein